VSGSDEEVLRFIAASFPSVWALELLLALKQDGALVPSQELVTRLRASEVVVSRALEALAAAGLASVEGAGAMYLPVSAVVDGYVARVQTIYRSRPNLVRRTIVMSGRDGATAFADAFMLRRKRDD
jgi:DNA-binding IclR family transcriptional regulator